MATLTIRNLPEKVYETLKERAALNRRSLNQEIILVLETHCQEAILARNWREAMAAVDELRKSMTSFPTTQEIDQAMDVGRK